MILWLFHHSETLVDAISSQRLPTLRVYRVNHQHIQKQYDWWQKEKMEAQLCCCTWFAIRSRAHTKADYHHQFHGHNVLYYRVSPQSTKVLGLLKSLLQDGYGVLLKHPQ